ILASRIEIPKKSGMLLTNRREQIIASEWIAFHLANEHHLGDRTFNLVDIFAGAGDVRSKEFRLQSSLQAEAKAEALWRKHQLTDAKVIGFHIGASRSNKAWAPQKFKSVIQHLLDTTDNQIVLFGGYNEIGLKDDFQDISSTRFTDLIGESNLDELIALVRRVDLFVTNDTGPMHIAAATCCKILNLSLGPVSFWETGPYIDGAFIMQADIDCHPCSFSKSCYHQRCHEIITPDAVCRTIIAIMGEQPLPPIDGVLTWKAGRDIFGLMHALPTAKRPIRPREFLFECKRAVWAMTLLKNLQPDTDWVKKYMQYLTTDYELVPYADREILAELESLQKQATEYAAKLCEIARESGGTKKSIDKIKTRWSSAKVIKDRMFAHSRQLDVVYDFYHYATFRETAISSNGLQEQIRQTAAIYSNLSLQLTALTRILKEK
ncbi:MAG: glycosyltransferase family 9 protein, partial [Candidatus Cloacimonetes bacterium]|nr:glycosyltransferase family 9 protein [Candidatus Cloacimonadota bacterium]